MIRPLIVQEMHRRAILDLLNEIGGEHNDAIIHMWMSAHRKHPISRREIVQQLDWLAERGLVDLQPVGEGVLTRVARITADGRDVSDGHLDEDGVYRHKTGQ